MKKKYISATISREDASRAPFGLSGRMYEAKNGFNLSTDGSILTIEKGGVFYDFSAGWSVSYEEGPRGPGRPPKEK